MRIGVKVHAKLILLILLKESSAYFRINESIIEKLLCIW